MSTALINATLYDFKTFKTNHYLIFDETITAIGPMRTFKDKGYRIIDCKHHLVLPSLIVGHTHIYSTFARGMSVPFAPENFQDILDQLWWKLDRNLNNTMIYYSGIVSAVDYLKNGVTTLIDHHASGADITGSLTALKKAVVDAAGLRGIFAFETSDRFDIERCMRENETFMRDNQDAFTRGLYGLHASLSLSDETLKAVSQRLNGAPIHIHAAESAMDQSDALEKYGERVIDRLHRHRLLTKDSIITHAIYVEDYELDRIKVQDAVIAVNVTSNMNNGVGLPPIPRFQEKKIPVLIGNDGISTSITTEYLNILYAMHHKYQDPKAFSLDDLKAMINDTYAYASRQFNKTLGSFEKGAEADILMLPYTPPTPMTSENVFGHLFFGCFNSFKPSHVFIAGQPKVIDYNVDSKLEKQYQEAHTYAQQLWDTIEKEG